MKVDRNSDRQKVLIVGGVAGGASCAASALRYEYLLCSKEEPYDRLTEREREIFRLMAEGYSSRQIAYQLLISLKTALNYRNKIEKKLDIRNRTELIKYAIRKGLVEV